MFFNGIPANKADKPAVVVSDYATGGTGTAANPWTGWDTATPWAAETHHHFPAGVYSYSVAPQWGLRFAKYTGEHAAAVLKYTGTGAAVNFVTTNFVSNDIMPFGVLLDGFLIDGGGQATYGIDLQAVHFSSFKNVRIKNVTQAHLRTRFSVSNYYERIEGTGKHGATVNPIDGFFLDDNGDPNQLTTTSVFVDCVIENVSRDGVHLEGSLGNTFIGGMSEINGRYNVYCGPDSFENVFLSLTLEQGATAAAYIDNSDFNQFINNHSANGTITIAAGSQDNRVIGGNWATITDNGTRTIVEQTAATFAGSPTAPYYRANVTKADIDQDSQKRQRALCIAAKASGTQTVGRAFTKILMDESTDIGGNYDPATSNYTCPYTGTYQISTKIRLADATPTGISYGQGSGGALADGAHFIWSTTGAGGRQGLFNQRIVVNVGAGTTLFLYAYVDDATARTVLQAEMTIEYLGTFAN